MKECVYGWYPPANDPWKSYRDPAKDVCYDEEGLYRHWSAKYHDQAEGGFSSHPATPFRMPPSHQQTRPLGFTPAAHLTPGLNPLLTTAASPQPPSRTASRAASRTPSRRLDSAANRTASASASQASLRIDGQTPAGAPVRVFSPPLPSRPKSTRSSVSVNPNKKPWSTRVAETQITLPSHPITEARGTTGGVQPRPRSEVRNFAGVLVKPPYAGGVTVYPISETPKPVRIQSATAHRPRVTPPSRPIHSADPRKRPPIEETRTAEEAWQPEADEKENENIYDEDDEDELGVDDPLDYDEQLTKYGWRMEVPGDPLKVKRQCFPKRKKITVSVPIPDVAPDPPKVHMESSEPFFSNTIPRKPLTVTIHGDWASEVLCAKRLELQKRDGDKYKYKTHSMSFIY